MKVERPARVALPLRRFAAIVLGASLSGALPSSARADDAPAPAAPAPAACAPVPAPAPAPAASAAGEPITMPFGDLTISEGKIVRWAKAEGDQVKAGELVAEIETDKAVVEIEAPVAGVLARIEEREGAVVKMGGRIGVVRPNR